MTGSITGIIAPVITPFDEMGRLLDDQIAASVEYTIDCGCHAIVASGTGVQETASLTPGERKRLVTETIDAVDGRVPVLAGVSYPAAPIVNELVDHAEAAGADALLAMPPWGVPPSPAATVRYFENIATATSLPVLAYNNPAVTVDMDKETMFGVAQIDGVEYVKESLRDWEKLAWLFEQVHHAGHATVFATMDVLLWTLQTAGSGIITPAPLTDPAMEIYEAYQAGELERAAERQRVFSDFPPAPADVGLTPVCKAATELAGVDVGPPRPPYDALEAEGRAAVGAWMDSAGIPREE